MAKADVTALANTLLDSTADTTALGTYYDRLVYELGRNGWLLGALSLTGASFVAAVRGTQQYAWPTTAIKVIGTFYDDTQLAEDDARSVEQAEPNWRTGEYMGRPAVFVRTDEDQRTDSLVPVPDVDGKTIGGGTPFVPGSPFPAENVMFVYTENRTDVHADEELAFALEIAAREWARDSNHQDKDAAQMAHQLAEMFLRLSHPELP